MWQKEFFKSRGVLNPGLRILSSVTFSISTAKNLSGIDSTKGEAGQRGKPNHNYAFIQVALSWPAAFHKRARPGLNRVAELTLPSAQASFIQQRSAVIEHQSNANIPRFCPQALQIAVI
jgi:hypothetical protein